MRLHTEARCIELSSEASKPWILTLNETGTRQWAGSQAAPLQVVDVEGGRAAQQHDDLVPQARDAHLLPVCHQGGTTQLRLRRQLQRRGAGRGGDGRTALPPRGWNESWRGVSRCLGRWCRALLPCVSCLGRGCKGEPSSRCGGPQSLVQGPTQGRQLSRQASQVVLWEPVGGLCQTLR